MTKILMATILAVLSLTMLLPVAGSVNAAPVNHFIARQGFPVPPSGGGGGHFIARQGFPVPPSGGGGGH